MTLETLHIAGSWAALIAYALLTALFIVAWARKIVGRAAIVAAILTTLHFLARTLLGMNFPALTLGTLALLGWIMMLANLLGLTPRRALDPTLRPILLTLGIALILGFCSIVITGRILLNASTEGINFSPRFVLQILINVSGLVFVEQLMSNVKDEERWRIRYLGIGLGTLFSYKLLLNAAGLHQGEHSLTLVALEPTVMALIAPCLAIAVLRNREAPMELRISREVVFRAGTLVLTGVALLTLGIFGYLVQTFEGDWRLALVTLVTITALMGLAIVLGSSRVRSNGRQWIAEHLFPQKFDYRGEWLRVTRQLTEPSPDYDLPQQVIRTLGRVTMTEGGAVWVAGDSGLLTPLGQLNCEWNRPISAATGRMLAALFETDEEILDLRTATSRNRIVLTDWPDLAALAGLRFIIPLMTESRLAGIVALKNPVTNRKLDREDYDVLRLIGRQAAGIVALQTAQRALADAEKLQGFNQLSAFLLHDVKTIAAQLSLLLRNAEKHRNNPAFIDDMLKTLENAVQRVNRLLEQLRGESQVREQSLELSALLKAALEPFRSRDPAPILDVGEEQLMVIADPHKLTSAIGHLVQNAIDAAAAYTAIPHAQRWVRVTLARRDQWAEIHIEDSGAGMDRAFIETRLFQPLSSTKGVSGMGLGAYQAKTYLRALGGDVGVTSEPGKGSHFVIRLTLEQGHA